MIQEYVSTIRKYVAPFYLIISFLIIDPKEITQKNKKDMYKKKKEHPPVGCVKHLHGKIWVKSM